METRPKLTWASAVAGVKDANGTSGGISGSVSGPRIDEITIVLKTRRNITEQEYDWLLNHVARATLVGLVPVPVIPSGVALQIKKALLFLIAYLGIITAEEHRDSLQDVTEEFFGDLAFAFFKRAIKLLKAGGSLFGKRTSELLKWADREWGYLVRANKLEHSGPKLKQIDELGKITFVVAKTLSKNDMAWRKRNRLFREAAGGESINVLMNNELKRTVVTTNAYRLSGI